MTPRSTTDDGRHVSAFFQTLIACLAIAAGVLGSLARAEPIETEAFVRRIGRLTGNPGTQGNIDGQDSPVWVEHRDEVYIFFGDTEIAPADPFPDRPNTGAVVRDSDPSDGLDLEYFVDEEGDAIALIRKEPGESTVWFTGAWSNGETLYAYYTAVLCGPQLGVCTPLGRGIAEMRDGVVPFDRTEFYVSAEDAPFFRPQNPYEDGGYLYFLPRHVEYFFAGTFAMRVRKEHMFDLDAYEWLTRDGWSNDRRDLEERLAFVSLNTGSFSVQRCPYLGQRVAVTTQVWGNGGLHTALQFSLAAEPAAWSPSRLSFEAPAGDGYGPLYNASWHPALNAEGGRIGYVGATEGDEYNVYLYEWAWDYARVSYRLPTDQSDGDARIRARGTSKISLNRSGLKLTRRGKRVVGLRFEGLTYQSSAGDPSETLSSARLILPLTREVRRSATLPIEISAGPVNPVRYAPGNSANPMSQRSASVVVDVDIEKGDLAVTIADESLRGLIASYYADYAAVGQRFGDPVALELILENLDRRHSLVLQARSERRGHSGAQLDLCFGACPPAEG